MKPNKRTMMMTTDRKQELQEELEKIEQQEAQARKEEAQEEAFERFMKRPADSLVGRAHCDETLIEARYHSERMLPLLPIAVSVRGNCGTTYQGEMPLSNASQTYFHNVWPDSMKDAFDRKLVAFVIEQVSHITSSLPFVLELMGLNDNTYHWFRVKKFPAGREAEVTASIHAAQDEQLDKFDDQSFIDLTKPSRMVNVADGSRHQTWRDLSHSRAIFERYIATKRPHLLAHFDGMKQARALQA